MAELTIAQLTELLAANVNNADLLPIWDDTASETKKITISNFRTAVGVSNWSESFSSTTQATSRWIPNNAATNVNAAIVPKGNGAIVAAIPDGTAVGGNSRGQYAVDLQMQRANANQVVENNFSFIGSGYDNRITSANATRSAIVSGNGNSISGFSYASFVGAGSSNVINGSEANVIVGGLSNQIVQTANEGRSFIGGGGDNIIRTGFSVIAGGRQCQTNNNGSYYQTIGGGQANITNTTGTIAGGLSNTISSSGTHGSIGGGQVNTASATHTTVGGGNGNTASGQWSAVVGGQSNTTSGTWSFIGGGQLNASAGYYNVIGGGFTNSGTANAAVTTQSTTTTSGTTAATLSGANASIKVGQYITGTGIASDTYVAAISGTSLTLSKNASGSGTNTLSFFTPHGVVVGGGNNQATGSYSFIGGGGDAGTAANRNVASGDWSAVVGGRVNTASGIYSVVGGGIYNIASGLNSTVGGGGDAFSSVRGNFARADYSTISGGRWHEIDAASNDSTIGGGVNNVITNTTNGTIAGGNNNRITAVGGFAAGSSNSVSFRGVAVGDGNVVSGLDCPVAFGQSNTASQWGSSIGGGKSNTASGQYSRIGGGQSNTSGSTHDVVCGGQSNGTGGNNNSFWKFIGGGSNNTVSGDQTSYSGIACGNANQITSGRFAFIGGGRSNTANSGAWDCTIGGGQSNYANGNGQAATHATISGGNSNTTSAFGAIVTGGSNGIASLYCQQVHASGQFSAQGDAQAHELIWRREITGTAQTELFLDGSSIAAILPSTNSVWHGIIDITSICSVAGAGTTVVGDVAATSYKATIKRLNTNTALVGSVQEIGTLNADVSMAAVAFSIDANNTNESLRIQFTPPPTAAADTVIRVVATFRGTQIKY